MALTPQNNDAFFREVDEDLRRDQVQRFLVTYGRWIAAAVVLFLVAVAAVLWWNAHRHAQAGIDSEKLSPALQALENGHAAGDQAALAQVASSPRDGYQAAARLTAAASAALKGDTAGAAATYAAIAGDTGLPQPIRDMALLRGTAVQADRLTPQQIIDRLKPLAVTGNPWFGSAAELTASAWLRLGQKGKAGQLFAAIARDKAAPGSLRARAATMATTLGQAVPVPGGEG